MEPLDAIVILGTVWSCMGGLYIYLTWKRQTDTALEEYRQAQITARKDMKPREWWQDVLVNLSNNPTVIEKLLPMLQSGALGQLMQQFKK